MSGAKQRGGPVEIASGPAPLVASPGRTGQPRRLGEGSFSSGRVLYYVYKRFRHFSSSPQEKVYHNLKRGEGEADDNFKFAEYVVTEITLIFSIF